MRFTLRQLEYFIAAGETGSVTLAADRAHISPASISTGISFLEKELQVQLFVRHHALGLSLTPAGREFLREAKTVIDKAEGLYTLASEATDRVRGNLTLGCLITLAPMVVPELSHSFSQAFPAVRLQYIERDHERLLGDLQQAKIDMALTYDLNIPDDIQFTSLTDMPPQVVFGVDHAIAGCSSIGLRELAEHPMVLLDLPMSREYFIGLFLSIGVQPKIAASSEYLETVRTMVANGYGYTLLNVRPRSDVALDGRKLLRVPLEGSHVPMRMGIARLKQLKPTKKIEAFESHCKALISKAYVPGMTPLDLIPKELGAELR